MTRRTRVSTVALAFAVVAGAACHFRGSDGTRVPTSAEARAVLGTFVAATRTATSAEEYCAAALFAEACAFEFGHAGGLRAMPRSEPRVVSDTRIAGGSTRVLVVCGVTGAGKPYRGDFPVHFDTTSGMQATIPVFWAGTTFSGVQSDGHAQATSDPTPSSDC